MSKVVKSYRLGEDEEVLVRIAAARAGLPPSTFVREAAVERAAEVVLGRIPGRRDGADGEAGPTE